jgi:hypothetical protein
MCREQDALHPSEGQGDAHMVSDEQSYHLLIASAATMGFPMCKDSAYGLTVNPDT